MDRVGLAVLLVIVGAEGREVGVGDYGSAFVYFVGLHAAGIIR